MLMVSFRLPLTSLILRLLWATSVWHHRRWRVLPTWRWCSSQALRRWTRLLWRVLPAPTAVSLRVLRTRLMLRRLAWVVWQISAVRLKVRQRVCLCRTSAEPSVRHQRFVFVVPPLSMVAVSHFGLSMVLSWKTQPMSVQTTWHQVIQRRLSLLR